MTTEERFKKLKRYERKNHGINAHLKPRLYFVSEDDAMNFVKDEVRILSEQLPSAQMQYYHDKIAKLINEKAELAEQLNQERNKAIDECQIVIHEYLLHNVEINESGVVGIVKKLESLKH